MPFTAITAKVLGTATIGLWAGYNLSLAQIVAPLETHKLFNCLAHCGAAPESADAAGPAPTSFAAVKQTLQRAAHAAGMSGLTFITFLASYVFAPRSAKHPYLLYVALGAPLVGLLQCYGSRDLTLQATSGGDAAAADAATAPDASEGHPDLGASSYEHITSSGDSAQPAEHKTVEEEVPFELTQKVAIYFRTVGLLSTSLFLLSLIGLAGDSARRF